MKKLFLSISLLMIAIVASAQVKTVDIKGNLRDKFGLGVGVTTDLGKGFELAPSLNYYFIEDFTLLTLEADVHYDFNVAENWNVYPIGGLALQYAKPSDGDGDCKIGVNLGVGTEYQFTPKMKGFVEGKYQWVDGWDDTYFSIGVRIGL